MKPYYDLVTYFATQLIFCFTTTPFVLLTLPDSLLVWTRVYFYAIVAVAASLLFFASPGKAYLIEKLKARQCGEKPALKRTASQDTISHPILGLPSDPGRDIDEAVQEVKDEVESRRRKGSVVKMPEGKAMKAAVEDKLGKKL